jgi:PilZ domain
MSERRTSARHKSLLRGRIHFNNRQSAVDCLVRDLSDEGAKLIFADTAGIPDKIELYIPQKEQTLLARVRWRSDGEVGVAFKSVQASARNAGVAELADRVEQLEAQVASLKRMLKRLKAEVAAGGETEAA